MYSKNHNKTLIERHSKIKINITLKNYTTTSTTTPHFACYSSCHGRLRDSCFV